MELSWPVVVFGWVVALLAGGGGVALIHRLFVQPKVYLTTDSWRLVPKRDDERHGRAERILRDQGLPTAVFDVCWWNGGRRRADNVDVEITVPGDILDLTIEPDSDDIDAPWEIVKAAEDYFDGRSVRLTQPELRPNGEVRVTVGYEAPDKEEKLDGTVAGYFGDRSMLDADAPSRRVLLPAIPGLLLSVGFLGWMIAMGVDQYDSVGRGILEFLGVLAGSFVLAVVLLILMGGWQVLIERKVTSPPSERS